jgi:hypothetical protein
MPLSPRLRLCLVVVRNAVLVGICLGALGTLARANPYESFLDVETEQDLRDALSVRQISSETFERLLDLLARGVDLDRASRQELYELPNLTYREVDAILAYRASRGGQGLGDGSPLVAAGILEDQRLSAIAPFLQLRSSAPGLAGVRGRMQTQARATLAERGPPPLGLRMRATGFDGVTAGVALALTRQRLDDVRYEPNRQVLVAAAPGPRVSLAKAYLQWQGARHAVLVGSYRAGFGQRLVFDNSGAEQPEGFVFDDQLVSGGEPARSCKLSSGEAAAPCAAADSPLLASDVRWREALWGAAASLRRLAAGPGLLSLHAFASYAPRAVYQYELVDRRRCPVPGREADPACAAPPVIQAPSGELLSPAFRHAYQTLPAMFAEALVGAHAGYALPRGLRAGLTGYGARSRDLIGGAQLATGAGARLPGGQRFGALGGELALRRGGAELGAEVARSLGEDGLGAVLRLALSRGGAGDEGGEVEGAGGQGGGELELMGRYYQASFVNPYARPLAAADELLGQRARDEAGVRVRTSRWWPKGSVRAELDAWRNLSGSALELSGAARGELQLYPRLRGGAGLAFDDKDLAHGGRRECFEGAAAAGEGSADGAAPACRGEKLAASARLTAQWSPLLDTTAQVQHEVLGAGDGWQQRLTLWLLARRRAASGMQLRAQLRYRDEALGAATHRSLGGGGEVRFPLGVTGRLAVRLDGQLPLSSGGSVAAGALQTLSLGVSYDVEL